MEPGGEMSSEPTVLFIDAKGKKCAKMLIQIRNLIVDLPAEQVILIESTDPVSQIDIPAWCHFLGHEHLSQEEKPEGVFQHRVKLSGNTKKSDPKTPWHRSEDL